MRIGRKKIQGEESALKKPFLFLKINFESCMCKAIKHTHTYIYKIIDMIIKTRMYIYGNNLISVYV